MNRLRIQVSWPQIHSIIEWGLWVIALVAALSFVALQIRAWAGVGRPRGMDFSTYYAAAQTLMVAPEALYDKSKPVDSIRRSALPYLYPPTFAALLRPLATLTFEEARRVWFWLNIAAAMAIVMFLYRLAQNFANSRGHHWLMVWIAILGFLLTPALVDTLILGQVGLLLGLLITLAIYLLKSPAVLVRLAAGMLIAIAAATKPFLLALFLLPLVRRDRYLLIGICFGLVGYFVIGLFVAPGRLTIEYFRVLLTSAQTLGPTEVVNEIINNQSLLAFWEKLSYSGELEVQLRSQPYTLFIQALAPAAATQIMKIGSALLITAGTGWALFRSRSIDASTSDFDICLILLSALTLSPLTWSHYLTIMPPLFVIIAAISVRAPKGWRLLAPLGFLLIILQRTTVIVLLRVPVLALSSLFLGGILCWWLVLFKEIGRHQRKPVLRT